MKELSFDNLEFNNSKEEEFENQSILDYDITVEDIIFQKTTDDNFYTNFFN